MDLDINYLKSFGKFVIHCEAEDQADELLKLIWGALPGKLVGWTASYSHWNWYDRNTCYALHLDNPKKQMQFSPISYWEEHGYKIIPFYEVFTPNDLGEIQKDGCFDTNLLYEIGV